MKFISGKVIEKFYVGWGGGKIEVIFRYPKMSDVDGLLKYINSLIEEGARIIFVKKVTQKEEIEYVKKHIKELKKGTTIALVIEINKKISGKGDIWVGIGSEAHVAEIGLGITKEYRGLGVGKRLMKVLIKMAKRKWKIEIVKIRCSNDNLIAVKLYKKLGFKETGKIPKGMKFKGKYYDDIIMCKRL